MFGDNFIGDPVDGTSGEAGPPGNVGDQRLAALQGIGRNREDQKRPQHPFQLFPRQQLQRRRRVFGGDRRQVFQLGDQSVHFQRRMLVHQQLAKRFQIALGQRSVALQNLLEQCQHGVTHLPGGAAVAAVAEQRGHHREGVAHGAFHPLGKPE